MDNVGNFVKKNKGLILVIAVILVVGTIIGINMSHSTSKTTKEDVSSVEKIKLTEISNSIIDCFEDIEDTESKELDKYIIYALDRNYLNNESDSLTTEDMAKFLNDIFSINIAAEDLENTGISPAMLDKNIVYDFNAKTFTMFKSKLRMSEIAETKIYKYELNEMYKEDGKYIVTFNKYIVSNPYQILNYYNDLNNKASQPVVDEETGEVIEEASGEKVDTKEISDYLRGNATMETIKKYITSQNIDEVGENKGVVTIKFVEKDDKLLIDSIS